jgi:CDP-6-deoxy-D-xylo-4-hexulose-3-dehydrase
MTMTRFPLASDTFEAEEINAAKKVLDSRFYTMGEQVKSFESEIGKWIGAKHVIMVNSGSSANLLLIQAMITRTNPKLAKFKTGDEVLVPALAWSTTVWPLVQLGLVPVFVDCDEKTLAIDLKAAQKSLSPKTKGMFLIHVLGLACDMSEYNKFCKNNSIELLEDCCESLGAFYEGKHVGNFGLGGTLSHFFSHHLTTMEGGCVFTNDDQLADDLRSLRAHGWIRERSDKQKWVDDYSNIDPRFMFIMPGYNVRPMEVQAAIGLVQLKKLDQFLDKRLQVAQAAQEILSKVSWIELIGKDYLNKVSGRNGRRHSWMSLPLRLAADAPVNVKKVHEILEQNGVETRPIIAGNIAEHPGVKYIQHRIGSPLNNANNILTRGLMIGCHPKIESEHLQVLENACKKLAAL